MKITWELRINAKLFQITSNSHQNSFENCKNVLLNIAHDFIGCSVAVDTAAEILEILLGCCVLQNDLARRNYVVIATVFQGHHATNHSEEDDG